MRASSFFRLLAVLAIVAVAVAMFFLRDQLPEYVRVFRAWVEDVGFYGPVVVAAFYVVSCVLFIPGSLVTIVAGLLFGVVLGTVTVSIGSVAGASAAFMVGRYLARDAIEAKVANNAMFQTIAGAVEKKGFLIVLLTRLSPVFPFNLLNYAFGLTRVSFGHYFFASWIGMFPATVLYVYLGSVVKSLSEFVDPDRQVNLGERVFFWSGLVVALIVTVVVTRIARKALQEAVPEEKFQIPHPKSQ